MDELEASLAKITKSLDNQNWFLDSSVSVHMTKERNILQDIKIGYGKNQIIDAGGGHNVQGVRSTLVKIVDGKIKLSNVLYVPSITKYLISVEALTDDGVMVFFKNRSWLLSNMKKRSILATGVQEKGNGLYKFQFQHEVNTIALDNKAKLWHK